MREDDCPTHNPIDDELDCPNRCIHSGASCQPLTEADGGASQPQSRVHWDEVFTCDNNVNLEHALFDHWRYCSVVELNIPSQLEGDSNDAQTN